MKNDPVNHPSHYTSHPSGVECIQVTEHMGFNLGNAFKYLFRRSIKHENDGVDMKKALWYVDREVQKRRAKHVEDISKGREVRGQRQGEGAPDRETPPQKAFCNADRLPRCCRVHAEWREAQGMVRPSDGFGDVCGPVPGRDGSLSFERCAPGQPPIEFSVGDEEEESLKKSAARDGLFGGEESGFKAYAGAGSGNTSEQGDRGGAGAENGCDPSNYWEGPQGGELEVMRVAEYEPYNIGAALLNIWRADLKNDAIEDLKKAQWYIEREIAKREKEQQS